MFSFLRGTYRFGPGGTIHGLPLLTTLGSRASHAGSLAVMAQTFYEPLSYLDSSFLAL